MPKANIRKKNDNRHLGVNVNLWFPKEDYRRMEEAMKHIGLCNKSGFIRDSVKFYVKWLGGPKPKGAK